MAKTVGLTFNGKQEGRNHSGNRRCSCGRGYDKRNGGVGYGLC